jgi:hypothetical protein
MHADDFLKAHPELRPENLPGPLRSKVEHYWTCGPRWIADVMEQTGEPAVYVDADCKLFASPETAFAEIAGAPAGFFGHNFARAADCLPGPTVETHEIFGRWNVGLAVFGDPTVIARWAEMCRAWCFDRVEQVEEPWRGAPDRADCDGIRNFGGPVESSRSTVSMTCRRDPGISIHVRRVRDGVVPGERPRELPLFGAQTAPHERTITPPSTA